MECEGGVIKRRLAVRNVCNGMVNQSQGGLADCRVGGDGRGRDGTEGFSAFGSGLNVDLNMLQFRLLHINT